VYRVLRSWLDRKLIWFVLVGGAGFLVDAAVLQVLVFGFGLNVFLARLFSFVTAASVTWTANRALTFSAPSRPWRALSAEWLRYLLTSLGGAAVNYGAFAIAISSAPTVRSYPVIAVAIGSVAGMCVNYALYARVVFRTNREQ
jgi:putative flippase GtrA